MRKHHSFSILGGVFACVLLTQLAHAEQKTTTTESTTTQTTTPPPAAKKSVPTSTITTSNVTVTNESTPKTGSGERAVLDEAALKKMSNMLCSEGFKPYFGSDRHNVCGPQAKAPDLAYSCVWDKKGDPAFAPTPKGPCLLDYSEHRGSVVISKTDYADNPPLPYGVEAQCCYRSAQ